MNCVKIQAGMSSGSSGGKPPDMTTVSERAMNSMPSVAMKLGMPKRIVTMPLMRPITAQTQQAEQHGRPERHAVVHQDRGRHRHQGEHRADRKVELAADHQQGDADRDERHLGQEAEHAAEVLGRQEHAVRAPLEHADQHDQQHDAGEFRLFQVDFEEALHR